MKSNERRTRKQDRHKGKIKTETKEQLRKWSGSVSWLFSRGESGSLIMNAWDTVGALKSNLVWPGLAACLCLSVCVRACSLDLPFRLLVSLDRQVVEAATLVRSSLWTFNCVCSLWSVVRRAIGKNILGHFGFVLGYQVKPPPALCRSVCAAAFVRCCCCGKMCCLSLVDRRSALQRVWNSSPVERARQDRRSGGISAPEVSLVYLVNLLPVNLAACSHEEPTIDRGYLRATPSFQIKDHLLHWLLLLTRPTSICCLIISASNYWPDWKLLPSPATVMTTGLVTLPIRFKVYQPTKTAPVWLWRLLRPHIGPMSDWIPLQPPALVLCSLDLPLIILIELERPTGCGGGRQWYISSSAAKPRSNPRRLHGSLPLIRFSFTVTTALGQVDLLRRLPPTVAHLHRQGVQLLGECVPCVVSTWLTSTHSFTLHFRWCCRTSTLMKLFHIRGVAFHWHCAILDRSIGTGSVQLCCVNVDLCLQFLRVG